MTHLKKYIEDHRDEFDSDEPAAGHFDRFEDRLAAIPGRGHGRPNRTVMLRIAALIVILICVSVFVFDLARREVTGWLGSERQGTELPAEIKEAVQYYDDQTRTQIAVIHKLAADNKDAGALNASALKEIRDLDAITNDLKESLAENPGNERILDAIVQNEQMKGTMLNTIITQLSQNKNQSIQ